MVDGVRSAAGRLYHAAQDAVNNAIAGAKRALGIASPSKVFAELGRMSIAGYAEGFDGDMLSRHVSHNIQMPVDSFRRSQSQQAQAAPQVSVGGAQIVAYLQIGDDQLHPVVVRTMQDNPQEVALAAEQGNSQLSRRR
jgi:hypothetical protein